LQDAWSLRAAVIAPLHELGYGTVRVSRARCTLMHAGCGRACAPWLKRKRYSITRLADMPRLLVR
jgi:hypothetical protein